MFINDSKAFFCKKDRSQFVHPSRGKSCFVVDPERNTDQYIEEAMSYGILVTHVFETHLHADFIAWHTELAKNQYQNICSGKGQLSFRLYTSKGR